MRSNYKRLGEFIEEVEERNRDLLVTLSQGICNQKYFQNPRQVAVNSAADKIVRKGWFAYNRATTRNGDKISIAYRDDVDCTVSASYLTFRIKDENKLNPYYLMMWFKRPEFDRYARFKSHGSAHEYFEWDEMCNVLLPVPPIEEQRKIVAEYQAIEQRIENNRRLIATLEATAQTIYRKMFVEDIDMENLPEGWRIGTIGEFGMVVTGKTPSSNCPDDFGSAIDFITPSEFSGENLFCTKAKRGLSLDGITKLQGKLIPKCSIAVTCIGSDMGKVRICLKECISNQQINSIIMSDKNEMPFLFFTLRNMKDYFQRLALGSSTMPMLSKSEFEKIEVLLPSKMCMDTFAGQTFPIIKFVMRLESEIHILQQTQHIILSRLINL
ncbi:MAG: restriction endonuclease subunit S [Prevotella sp.]|nr:restriction endonuclease subunit S [Prevotella sp.]